MTHQFVTGSKKANQKDISSVGGTDNVDASVLIARFDYVALGHIHGPQQKDWKGAVRYCGTPLKYSFSEVHRHKVCDDCGDERKGKCRD